MFSDKRRVYKMRIIKAVVLLLIMSLAPLKAIAMDLQTIFFLQETLKNHGFDVGKPDGKFGPATRNGLNSFAKKYGVQSDAQSVLTFIFQKNLASRRVIEDETRLEDIKARVAEGLRDPSSALIRNVFEVDNPNMTIICGEVNGKNAYGGYAGFTSFFGISMFNRFSLVQIDDAESAFARVSCTMAFPKE